MDDKDFLDLLYQQWAKTTGAENQFWIVEGDNQEFYDDMLVDSSCSEGLHEIYAVDQEQNREMVAAFLSEADADFICGLHGCIGDLVRRMHSALDEADRADRERDEQEQSIFALAVENDELRQEIAQRDTWETELADTCRDNVLLRQELEQLRRERESWVSRAGDTLWKIERPM